MKKKLTPMMELFWHEFLIDKNATQAAIRAGYSEKTAYSQGQRLLKNVEIREKIDAELKKLAEKAGLTAGEIRKEWKRIAFFDIRKLFDENGQMKPVSELDPDTAAVVSSVEVIESSLKDSEGKPLYHTKKVKTWDKIKALQDAAKDLKMIGHDEKKSDVNVQVNNAVVLMPPMFKNMDEWQTAAQAYLKEKEELEAKEIEGMDR